MNNLYLTEEIIVEMPFSLTIDNLETDINVSKANKLINLNTSGYILTPGSIAHLVLDEDIDKSFKLSSIMTKNNLGIIGFYDNVLAISNFSKVHSVKLKHGILVGSQD